jgi:hypothetical protein
MVPRISKVLAIRLKATMKQQLGEQSAFAFASLKLRRTRFDLTVLRGCATRSPSGRSVVPRGGLQHPLNINYLNRSGTSARPIDSHRVFPALSHCFACYLIPPLGIEPHSSLPKSCGDFVRRFERNKARSDETCLAIYPHQTATGQHHHSSHQRGVVMSTI